MKQFSLLLVVLLLAACNKLPDDAIAAAYLHSREHPRLASCFNVLGQDPSPALISKLQAAKRTVSAASNCTKGLHSSPFLNGMPAEKVSVVKFNRISHSQLEIEFSSSAGGLSASGWVVTLDLAQGKWVVRKSRMTWIS